MVLACATSSGSDISEKGFGSSNLPPILISGLPAATRALSSRTFAPPPPTSPAATTPARSAYPGSTPAPFSPADTPLSARVAAPTVRAVPMGAATAAAGSNGDATCIAPPSTCAAPPAICSPGVVVPFSRGPVAGAGVPAICFKPAQICCAPRSGWSRMPSGPVPSGTSVIGRPVRGFRRTAGAGGVGAGAAIGAAGVSAWPLIFQPLQTSTGGGVAAAPGSASVPPILHPPPRSAISFHEIDDAALFPPCVPVRPRGLLTFRDLVLDVLGRCLRAGNRGLARLVGLHLKRGGFQLGHFGRALRFRQARGFQLLAALRPQGVDFVLFALDRVHVLLCLVLPALLEAKIDCGLSWCWGRIVAPDARRLDCGGVITGGDSLTRFVGRRVARVRAGLRVVRDALARFVGRGVGRFLGVVGPEISSDSARLIDERRQHTLGHVCRHSRRLLFGCGFDRLRAGHRRNVLRKVLVGNIHRG